MKFFNRWNNITGWAVFAVAAVTYLLTMEPAPSLWDCGETLHAHTNSKWDTLPERLCS